MENSATGTNSAATTNGASGSNEAAANSTASANDITTASVTNGTDTTNGTASTTNGAVAIPSALPKPPVGSHALAELLQAVDDQLLRPDDGEFVGREFVRAEIKQFLSVKNRMLVLVGPPGIGKTALAAQLVREQADCRLPVPSALLRT